LTVVASKAGYLVDHIPEIGQWLDQHPSQFVIKPMTGESIAKIISSIAAVLWVMVAAYALWILRQPLTAAAGRLAGVEAFGIKFALSGGAALNAAIELAQKNPEWPVEVLPLTAKPR
jgi:hypothetical protein